MEKRKEFRVKEEAACVYCFQGHADASRKWKVALMQWAVEMPGSS